MSSILKALKKLEDENNARTPDSLKIHAEILRGGESSRISLFVVILAAVFLFLGGGAVTYYYLKPVEKKQQIASSAERVVPASIVPAVPQDGKPQGTFSEVPPKSSKTAAPQKQLQSDKVKPHSQNSVVTTPQPQLRNHVEPQRKPHAVGSLSTEKEMPPIVAARPTVRVNGIAYQDGSDSVAVINGVPVSRGAVIEGARVEEIQRDRVLFSYGGEKFEVNLGKSNQ